MSSSRHLALGVTAASFVAAAFFACVGDDPGSTNPTNNGNDAGGTSSSGGALADVSTGDDASSTVDASDGGPRCDKSKAFGDPVVMPSPINTDATSDRGISMTGDELIAIVERDGVLLFTKRASTAAAFEPLTSDFMLKVNGAGDESSPSLSPDGMTLYFVRDGGIWVTHRSTLTESFPLPEAVLIDGSGTAYVESARILQDGSRLHWTSSEGEDTLIADRVGAGYATFTDGRPLAGNLASIAFSGDELTLYFLSPPDGGDVMKYATRATKSVGLGMQIDMPQNLRAFQPLHVTHDDCVMYVRARQAADATKFDIYEARRPQ